MLEVLGGIIAALLAFLGFSLWESKKNEKEMKEREEALAKEYIRRQEKAWKELTQGLENEQKAIADPDKHDFTK